MVVRCPQCASPLTDGSVGGEPTCGRCGHRFLVAEPRPSRSPLASLAGARDRLQHATRDLFRLSQHSIPVSAGPPDVVTSAAETHSVAIQPEDAEPQSSQSSMMFSLEELMKSGASEGAGSSQTTDGGLWEMQAATPLFGTAHDQALWTTPIEPPKPTPSAMAMPSRPASSRPPLPLIGGIGGAAALLLGGLAWWMTAGSGEDVAATARAAASPARAAAAVVAPVAAAEPDAPAESAPAPSPAGETAPPTADAPARAEPEPEPPPAESAPPAKPEKKQVSSKPKKKKLPAFSKSAAKSALISAAGSASSCRKAGGPGGKGQVQLTFSTSGRVSGARIVSGPMAGTAAGQCALRYFRAARVPAFSGSSVTVKKSFKIR